MIGLIFRRFRKKIFLMVVLLGLISLLQSAGLYLLGPFLKAVVSPDTEPLTFLNFLDDWPPYQSIPVVLGLVLFMRVGVLYVFQRVQIDLTVQVTHFLRTRVYRGILFQNYESFSKKDTGSWLSLLIHDTNHVQEQLSHLFGIGLKNITVLISCLIVLFYLNFKASLVLILGAVILGFVIGKIAEKVKAYAHRWQRLFAELIAKVIEVKQRLFAIQAWKSHAFEERFLKDADDQYFAQVKQSLWVRTFLSPGTELAGWAMLGLLALFLFWGGTNLRPEDLQLVIVFAIMVKPAKEMGEQLRLLQELRGVLQESHLLSQDQIDQTPKGEAMRLPAELRLKRLRLERAGQVILDLQDLRWIRGQSYFLSGPSGSGKSSFLKCMAGLMQPDQVESTPPWREWQQASNYLSQNPFLFVDSIQNNILFGSDGAQAELDSEVLDALRLPAEIPDFHMRFDPVNKSLSGGQIQRIAVARGLHCQGRDLILCDEIAANIGEEAEMELIQFLIERAKKDSAILIYVSHREHLGDHFDHVVKISQGKRVV